MSSRLPRSRRFPILPGICVVAALAWWPRVTIGADDPGVQVEYSAIHAASGGVNVYVPGKWGILNLEVTNPLKQPHELLSATYFEGQPTLQFGRRIWIPARSRLRTWQPVLAPALPREPTASFEFESLVLDAAAGTQVAARDDTGQILHSGILPAVVEIPITGFIDSLDRDVPGAESEAAYELVVTARLSQRLSTRLAGLRDRHYAPDDVSLQSLHQLVVADSRALEDPAGLAAIRRWVHGGGRLWVMLDRVDPRFLERLLGDGFPGEVVDRVGLTSIRIEASAKEYSTTPPAEAELERPVDLVRVVTSDMEVAFTVNGWPAALWKPLGAGKVLVTTLGPRGWMRLRTAADARWAPPGGKFVAQPPMAELAKFFLLPSGPPSTPLPIFESQAVEYIGYSIPPRWLISGLLAGVVGAIAGAGAWLLRRGGLAHLGWFGPGMALAVAAVLLIIGGLNRHAIPPTAALVDFTEAVSGTDDIHTRGAVALYNPESAPSSIATTRGGRLTPDMAGLEGSAKRLVWSDLEAWSWEHVTLAGQRLGTFTQSATLPERIEARGAFGPDGLSGQFSIPGATAPGDALIATPYGRMGVDLQAGGRFRAPAGNEFGPDQYLAAGLLSDEQDRRRRTYARLVPELFGGADLPTDPLLFVWTDRSQAAFEFGEGRGAAGGSLVAIPLSFDRPPVGAEVRVPSPFLPFRSVDQPDGTPSSPIWDHHQRQWLERSHPATAWLRFQLPKELLPVALSRLRAIIQVTGPVGRLEVLAQRRAGAERAAAGPGGGSREAVSLYLWHDPVGTSRPIEITDPELLQLDREGGLLLGIAGGDPDRPELTGTKEVGGTRVSFWKIERLSLELTGIVSH
jgi:hypothetical protein